MRMKEFYRADSIENAYQKLTEKKDNLIIGGGAWLKLTNKEVDTVIDLEKCNLDYIKESKDSISIGSMTTLYNLETNQIMTSNNSNILSIAISKIMGVGIKNIATIGGSICGKYSFSDILTPLLVLNTSLVFHKQGEISLTDYLTLKKPQKDILLEINIQKEKQKIFFKKVAKTSLDFALVNIAITKGETIRIAVGARPSIAVLATEAMEILNNNELTEETLTNAINKVDTIKFSTNAKASKEYRADLTKVYIRRGLKEVMNNES